ncbi:hypothetical protein ASG90_03185 [Nocardioides sp. Soil797]|nr:hypothetical protein ASG90_03185 [Nocardioides sp. Soil797]
MDMSLNIKNDRVHRLAREAAQVTGLSQTAAVEQGLELLLDKFDARPAETDRKRRLDVLTSTALAWQPDTDADKLQEIDELYDDHTGLPA